MYWPIPLSSRHPSMMGRYCPLSVDVRRHSLLIVELPCIRGFTLGINGVKEVSCNSCDKIPYKKSQLLK